MGLGSCCGPLGLGSCFWPLDLGQGLGEMGLGSCFGPWMLGAVPCGLGSRLGPRVLWFGSQFNDLGRGSRGGWGCLWGGFLAKTPSSLRLLLPSSLPPCMASLLLLSPWDTGQGVSSSPEPPAPSSPGQSLSFGFY